MQPGVQRKPGSISLKIPGNRRNFSLLDIKPDWRKCPSLPSRQALWPYSLKGTLVVRFRRFSQAKEMRLQIDGVAKDG
jgi:hypothetical protein